MKNQLIIVAFIAAFSALAALPAPAAEVAAMLPRGVSRFRVVTAVTGGIRDSFGPEGQAQSLAAGLNRSLSISDFARLNPRVAALEKALRAVDANLADNLVATNLFADFELRARTIVSAYEYGIRDWLNVGVRVPVVSRSGRAGFSAQTANGANALRARLGSLSQDVDEGLRAFAQQELGTEYFDAAVFSAKGYDTPASFDKTELGDAELGFKARFYQDSYLVSSAILGFRAPTGSRASRYNLFDKGSGAGAWAGAIQAFNDVYPLSWLTVGSAVRAAYYFPDRYETAVPKDANDALPSVREQDGQWRTVDRRMGFEWLGEFSTTARFFGKRVQTWAAFQFTSRGADTFSGADSVYYGGLSTNTGIESRNFELGIGYASIPDFLAHRVKVPFEINALYNWTVAGRNTPVVSYARVDMIGYF